MLEVISQQREVMQYAKCTANWFKFNIEERENLGELS